MRVGVYMEFIGKVSDFEDVPNMVYIVKTVNIDKVAFDVYLSTISNNLDHEKVVGIEEVAGSVTLRATKQVVEYAACHIGSYITQLVFDKSSKSASLTSMV